jgi:caa(3)-type oxidase subunit IV
MSGGKVLTRIWMVLLGLTAVEVVLAFRFLPPFVFLALLLVFSVGKAILIMWYFMHLGSAPRSMSLALFPLLVVLVVLLFAFLPDAVRTGGLRFL